MSRAMMSGILKAEVNQFRKVTYWYYQSISKRERPRNLVHKFEDQQRRIEMLSATQDGLEA